VTGFFCAFLKTQGENKTQILEKTLGSFGAKKPQDTGAFSTY